MPPKKKKTDPVTEMKTRAAHWRELIAGFLVLAVFTVHPLIITPLGYQNITNTKLFCFAGIVAVALILLCLVAALSAMTIPGYFRLEGGLGELSKKIRPYEYAILAYWLVMVISTLLSENKGTAIFGASNRNEGLLVMTLYFLAAVIVARLYRPQERDLMILCAAACVVSLYGLCQYYGNDFLSLNPLNNTTVQGPGIIYISTMSNRNVISTYLLLAFCIAAVMFAQKKKRIHWAYLPMAWLLFYMLIIGQTEGGYIGLLAAFAMITPFVAKDSHSAGRLLALLSGCVFWLWVNVSLHFKSWPPSTWEPFRPYLLPLSAILAAMAAVLLFARGLPAVSARIFRAVWYSATVLVIIAAVIAIPRIAEVSDHKAVQAANEILKGNVDDTLGSNRVFIWRRAITLVPDKLLLGHGPDNFAVYFSEAFGDEAAERFQTNYDKAHNEYLQVLFDNGILGLAALLMFYALIIKRALRSPDTPAVAAMLLALTCFLVQAFFNIFTPFAHPVVWVLWGMLAANGKGKLAGNSDGIACGDGV